VLAHDLLVLDLLRIPAPPAGEADLRPLLGEDPDQLARIYLEGYPPGVAAADLAQARAEMALTLTGGYGVLRPDASLVAYDGGAAVGAVFTVERSIWDADLPGPFIIDLVVVPGARGRGTGRALLGGAVRACARAGEKTLSLRTGGGTSAAAAHLYRELGFRPPS
jgi:acetyltransferase, GNAT family